MSSILNALKKLEKEKAAQQGQRVDITKDIFGDSRRPAADTIRPLIAGGFAGTVALGVVAYLVIARTGTRPAPPPSPVRTDMHAAASSPVPSRTAAPRSYQDIRQEAPKPTPTAAPPAHAKPIAATSNIPAVVTAEPAPYIAPPKGPAPPSPATPPKITVSGIAYHMDAADRLAIINGVSVGKGKTVSGVSVEEIMSDKVRFSYGQQHFEVPVGQSNQP